MIDAKKLREAAEIAGYCALGIAIASTLGYGYGYLFKTNPLFTAKFAAISYIATAIFVESCKKILPKEIHSSFDCYMTPCWLLIQICAMRYFNLIGKITTITGIILLGIGVKETFFQSRSK